MPIGQRVPRIQRQRLLKAFQRFHRPAQLGQETALVVVSDDELRVVLKGALTRIESTVANTLGALLKYQDDIGAVTQEVATQLVGEARREAAAELGL